MMHSLKVRVMAESCSCFPVCVKSRGVQSQPKLLRRDDKGRRFRRDCQVKETFQDRTHS